MPKGKALVTYFGLGSGTWLAVLSKVSVAEKVALCVSATGILAQRAASPLPAKALHAGDRTLFERVEHIPMSGFSKASGQATIEGTIVLFDAECVLCSANAQFILDHDKAERFRLASMQGDVGASLFRIHGLDPADPTSILVIDGPVVRKDSDAVLSIYEALGFPWKLAAVLRIVPRFVRDPVYRMVARNRYRWFGKRETCWIAPERYRSRVL